jgi:mannose-1-phosphate guanylyltransferase/mannose-6-phosphate isomerase
VPRDNIILEPQPLNTLPAILLCARIIGLKDKKANLLVLPSDHYIKGDRSFTGAALKALNLSSRDYICLMGLVPDSPCPGYGYITTAGTIGRGEFQVKSFKEKPDLSTAKRLFKKRNIFWNSGIFCLKAEVVLSEAQSLLPGLYAQIIRIKDKRQITKIWPKIKPISIDYGILQKSDRLVMVRAGFYWRDVGSWDALCSVLPKDGENNVILSDCISLDTSDTLVCAYGSKRLIAAIGLRGMIIVDTPDALLVCKKENAQDIKRLVELLKVKRKECV